MIDLKNKIVFIHIPKNAGTSIEKYFMDIRNLDFRNRAALGIFLNGFDTDLERANSHSSLAMIEDYYFGGEIPEEFKIFTVVRNPYNRFWSEWGYRRIPNPKKYHVSFYLPLKAMIYLAQNPVGRLSDFNSHMRSQWSFLEGKATERVRILRFENLAEDFKALKEDWKLPDHPLPRTNKSKRNRKPTEKLRTIGNAFVTETYADDFAKLGYVSEPS